MMAELGLYLLECPRDSVTHEQLHTMPDYNGPTSTSHTLMTWTQQAPKDLFQWGQPLYSSFSTIVVASSQLAWEPIPPSDVPTEIKAQLQQEGVHNSYLEEVVHLAFLAQMTRQAVPVGPTGHLLHKATLPIPGDVAAVPKTQKQTTGKQSK